jgi:hypothetical protein
MSFSFSDRLYQQLAFLRLAAVIPGTKREMAIALGRLVCCLLVHLVCSPGSVLWDPRRLSADFGKTVVHDHTTGKEGSVACSQIKFLGGL